MKYIQINKHTPTRRGAMEFLSRWLLLAFSLLSIANCTRRQEILISGSETMKNVIMILAEGFNASQKKYEVKVTGGGSKLGIDDLTRKRVDIAMTSNDISETHLAALADISRYEKVDIGFDGLAVVVHPSNPVTKIHLLQFSQILSGKISNWKELGGPDMAIIPVLRNGNSGSEGYVREHVLRRKDLGEPVYAALKEVDYTGVAVTKRDNKEIFDFISSNPGAIAYMGVGVAKSEGKSKIKILDYSLLPEGPYLPPSVDNIQAGKYRLSRPLALVYVPDNGRKDAFIGFALSEQGQNKIRDYDYMQAAPTTIIVKEKRNTAK